MSADRFVVISGCSGGGKSTLLEELAQRGYATVAEPGRRIIAEERATGGNALPWVDMAAFARRAVAMARDDIAAEGGRTFFDRGLIDAAVAMEAATGDSAVGLIGPQRYHPTVFFAPPWREIYKIDDDRPHDFATAKIEYEQLRRAYPALGYDMVVLPRDSVSARADFVLVTLGA